MTGKLDALILAGQKLSNIAYNFAHNYSALTEHDRQVMAVCCLDWDAALRDIRAKQSATRKPRARKRRESQ
jgi:hypothetical protein